MTFGTEFGLATLGNGPASMAGVHHPLTLDKFVDADTSPKSVLGAPSAISNRLLSIDETTMEPPVYVSFPIITQDFHAADLFRDRFMHEDVVQHFNGVIATTEQERRVRLATCFLQFVVFQILHAKIDIPLATSKRILTSLLQEYCLQFLQRNNNVHAASQNLPLPLRQFVIGVFYKSSWCLRQLGQLPLNVKSPDPGSPTVDVLAAPKPGLFQASKDGKASLLAIFGGQGADYYFDELLDIVKTYPVFVDQYVEKMANALRSQASHPLAMELYPDGLDVLTWIHSPEHRPSSDYLIAAPVSLPLIGLSQLLNYYVLFKILDISPKQLKSYFIGAAGHSQGIVAAVAISASDTEEEFFENSRRALLLLFWIGCRSQQTYPVTTLSPNILKESFDSDDGAPTPMLSVTNLSYDVLLKLVNEHNNLLPGNRRIIVSLLNGPRAFVCAGHPQSLHGLNVALLKMEAKPGQDESRVPFNKRLLKLSTRFLSISVPFHTDFLKDALDLIADDIERFDLSFPAEKLSVPVYSTDSGVDLRFSENLSLSLAEQICCKPVLWEKASSSTGATHILDFGPGGSTGIGALTHRNLDGTGVQIVLMGSLDSTNNSFMTKTQFLHDASTPIRSVNWKNEYRPKLVRTKHDGKVRLDTGFSRVVGKPPLMVAGMTPTTVNSQFVAATVNAGYHVELAGGGHYNEGSLRRTIDDILRQVPAGESITLNILYLNQAQWGFQFPLALRMKKEGVPIEGICVAAGVPSHEKAIEIVNAMKDAGLKHIAFKPGSIDAIQQVVRIASACPDFPVILQWTGGRAGGHHGFEDAHLPLLETYSSIRRQSNLILVFGSGIGDADGSLRYLTGEWSVPFGYPSMPVDGLLMGSRLMVAREAKTSKGAKDCIVAASGIEDESKWVESYEKVTGGVITVKSELGEPIHKVATRGVLLWKEFDDTIFSLTPENRAAALVNKKDYIIKRLNADFQKPWFGRRSDGSVADVQDMTYLEVVNRMIELMFVRYNNHGWIHSSYRTIVFDFLIRIQERFLDASDQSLLQSADDLLQPDSIVSLFAKKFPQATKQLLTSEDVGYFFTICSRRGQKPVPFIPVLDQSFETWFKKDSLWQAEDLDAVVDHDPQRVCILQGPVAVKHSRVVDEPVGVIMDSIVEGHIAALLERQYNNDLNMVPVVEFLGDSGNSKRRCVPQGVALSSNQRSTTYYLSQSDARLPEPDEWLDFVSGPSASWLRSLLTSKSIFQGKRSSPNPFQRVFGPRRGQVIKVEFGDDSNPIGIEIREGDAVFVRATFSSPLIDVSFFESGDRGSAELVLKFEYVPGQAYAPIHEIMEGRNDRIKEFYYRLWVGELPIPMYDRDSKFVSAEHTITRGDILSFCRCVGNQAESYVAQDQLSAPMDYAIVAGWKSIICALFAEFIDADILKLVHLSNSFRMLDPAVNGLREGDVVHASSQIESVVNTKSGKILQVKGTVFCNSKPVIEVVTRFCYRGSFSDFQNTFERIAHNPVNVELKTQDDVSVLESRPWFVATPGAPAIGVGSTLVFRLDSYYEYADQSAYSKVITNGTVSMLISGTESVAIGHVSYEKSGISYGDPVVQYLARHGSNLDPKHLFASGGYSVIPAAAAFSSAFSSPSCNSAYARVSGDVNPIHTNAYVAALAELPGTITHGMWTSAATKKWVEMFAADNKPDAVRAYSVNFVSMLLPDEKLETRLTHIGMEDGKKLIKIVTVKEDGSVVLEGTAEVDQPPTAFVFTGQGSQSKGMGMDLYDSSPIARSIWDRADKHFMDLYGVSILDIVRNNPTQRTVYFGNRRGAKIRSNYQALSVDVVLPDGASVKKPLFPEITEHTESYTFVSPDGLLSSTQFTQPALTLMEKAAFEDMKSKGLIPADCAFAGHSLGEYSALTSVADVLSIETLVDVVFYRGLSMQSAVPRDSNGRSNYGMVAVNPMRVNPKLFNERMLQMVVSFIGIESKGLLEIVNYNVEGQQYVVAGDLISLETLKEILNLFSSGKYDLKLLSDLSPTEIARRVSPRVAQIVQGVKSRCEPGTSFVALQRGFASIPLAGIDVPFHSNFLKSGVPAFRHYLSSRIKESLIDVSLLRHRYIPNVIAEPFDLSPDYIERVYKATNSETLQTILEAWTDESYSTPSEQQQLCRILLIELLAYQFASPVLWIQTQVQLYTTCRAERVIEIGPGPVLSGMADKTLKAKFGRVDVANSIRRSNLCYVRDRDAIYFENVETEAPAAPAQEANPAPAAASAPSVPVAAPVQVSAPAASSAAPITDAPISASEVLRSIIAHKLKRSAPNVALNQSIKDVVGGKSTMQNEMLGDLAKEFGSDLVPDKSEELPLDALAALLAPVHNGALGSYTTGLVNKLLSNKFPAGFGLSAVKSLLSKSYGLGPQRSDGVLLHAVTMEPSSRLSSESDVQLWISSVVESYCKMTGVVVSLQSSSESQNAQVAAVSSAELVQMQLRMDAQIRDQLESHARYLGLNLREGYDDLDKEEVAHRQAVTELDLWIAEHGSDYAEGIRPSFDPLKIRQYDSYWNWSHQEAFRVLFDLVSGRINGDVSAECLQLINRSNGRLVQHLRYLMCRVLDPARGNEQAKTFAQTLIKLVEDAQGALPLYREVSIPTGPRMSIAESGDAVYSEVHRPGVNSFADYVREMKLSSDGAKQPLIFLSSRDQRDPSQWTFDQSMTNTFFDVLESMVGGVSFHGKNVLVTGCGAGSIGGDLVKALLAAGAKVIATTSRLFKPVHDYFREIYENHGSTGSSLTVLQFNQGSKQDVDALIDFIYDSSKKGLGVDLDYIIPFAAISENGRSLLNIDSRSELAHRIMLTNLYRLLGNVAAKKQSLNQRTRPAQVILPLSPNHGVFGNDGLYSESKIGLESLLNRWESEDWSDFLTVVGAVIGWTRGTRLMSDNNLVAEGIEARGCRTFSTNEMTFNLIALMHPLMVRLSQQAPLFADLSGGMKSIANLKTLSMEIRSSFMQSASVRKAVLHEDRAEAKLVKGPDFVAAKSPSIQPRSNLAFDLPDLPTDLKSIDYMKGMLDLDRVIVVTGFGEVGPYGNARTRWEMEAFGEFSLEGCIELAWIMGYIKYVANRRNKDGTSFSGWVDSASDEPLREYDIKRLYEERILKHTGIRLIEPQLFNGCDPDKKLLLQEVVINSEMPAFECSRAEADSFRLQHGAFVDIFPVEGSSQFNVRLKKGATLYIPKALRFDRLVAGQIPTGWDAERYGVPKDIVDQVDPVTLYVLVSTVDALVSSGITDPYEFYEYVHVSSVGNTCGGGIGGMHALRGIFRERFLDKQVQKDVLQESFINTMPAWVNLLLLSSAGPIKSPVGACATAVQSVEIGVDTLLSGKASIVICGGYDDFTEESSQEFGNIGATSNSVHELAQGREPREMSRPATSSRGGFMESHGAGVHVLMTAKIAIEMGVPIYGIIAHTATAMDKVGRSVPAPGQGVLTTARESKSSRRSRLLDFKFRSDRLKLSRRQIKERADAEMEALLSEAETLPASERQLFIDEGATFIQQQSEREYKATLALWSHDFAKDDPTISPLRAALAVYGLTVDDIDVASFHGTGTKANDVNESEVVDKQLAHLGRSAGNLIPSIFQKYLTGHPKGAAAAWMLNGMLNVLNTGIIPGNRNADNIESKLAKMDFVFYPSRSIQTDGLNAGLLKSFGFGQVGGECLVIHPKFLFASLEASQLDSYVAKRRVREQKIYRYLHDSLIGSSRYVQLKDSPPFTPEQESAVYLDPLARAKFDAAKQTWNFSQYGKGAKPPLDRMFKDLIGGSVKSGIGCDNEWLSEFPDPDSEFIGRNFTPDEIAYCRSRPDPKVSFAGRWCAKEAVLKSISDFASKQEKVWDRGDAAPMAAIEILPTESGAPRVVLHGDAKRIAESVGVRSINVSISHSSVLAQAAAVSV